MKKIIILLTIVIFGGGIYLLSKPSAPNPVRDKFAQCLAEKDAVMYGAYWCSHCQNQKKLFSDSFQFIKYVECTNDVKLCQEKGIKGYPTWIFSDGSRIEGGATFSQLTEKTSCKAP